MMNEQRWTPLFGLVFIFLLSSCDFLSNNLVQRSLTKEKLMYLQPQGALIYGTVEKQDDDHMNGLLLMLNKSPDLLAPLWEERTAFLIEVPYAMNEISRYGVRYSLDGVPMEYWRTEPTRVVLSAEDRVAVTNETTSVLRRMVGGRVQEITNVQTEVTLETQVFYLGRFIVRPRYKRLNTSKIEYEVILTNRIDEDQMRFYELYPMLSNASSMQAEVYHTNR